MRFWLAILGVIGWALAQEERQVPGGRSEPAPGRSTSPQAYRIQGIVRDAESGEPLPGAYIRLKGSLMGTVSDAQGRFQLSTLGSPPFRVEVSYIGYENAEVAIEPNKEAEISLRPGGLAMKEVVITTSRVPEAVLEAPVTVMRMGLRELQLGAAANIFQQLSTMKNIDVNYQSITFPSIGTRGFNLPGNVRVVQRIDGIEMMAPVLGFPVGILSAPPDIDIEAVEVTAGPASALYGPNAFNGFIEFSTRQPRRYRGLGASLRLGVNHIASDTTPQPYLHFAARYAYTFGDRFSLKLVTEYLRATDWLAVDYTDQGTYQGADSAYAIPGVTNPGYNGVNLYGDEVRVLNRDLEPLPTLLGIRERFYVARTGYRDRDIVDPTVFLQKYTLQWQYFLNENLELSWRSFLVNGTTVYQASNRNIIKDAYFHQHKLELRGRRFFVRAYGSWESPGATYDSRFTGIFLNERAKPTPAWLIFYHQGYALYGSHEAARRYADTARVSDFYNAIAPLIGLTPGSFLPRPEPGTPEFSRALKEVNSGPYRVKYEAGLYDRSSFYHGEVQYDFSDWVGRWVELVAGGNIRLFRINTRGTLFVDYEGPFFTHEYGVFLQANRWFFDRHLRLLGSIRYDKNQYFQGRFTPRAALLYAFGPERQHSLRASYQTGFRIPTLQDQFIALDIGFREITLGGTTRARSAYGLDKIMLTPASVAAYRRAAQGVQDSATLAALAAQYLQFVPRELVRPEFVQQVEIGGRFQILRGLYIDAEFARAYYQDFILYRRVVSSQPTYETGTTKPIALSNVDPSTYEGLVNLRDGRYYTYNTASNASDMVYADFGAVSLEYAITPKILWTGSYSYAALTLREADDPSLLPNFNTPRHKFGSTLYLSGFGPWGGSLNYRWIDAFVMDGFIRGRVPAVQWIDAQVSYTIPKWKLQFRVGGQNLLNIRYVQFPGGPRVGGLYYFQVVYDPALR
ncbi:MAG: TonB-dependent receptor [Bacteroidia bacterium]